MVALVLAGSVHHLGHHQTYTDKLNGALAKLRADPKLKYLAKMGVDSLLQHLEVTAII